MAGIVENIKTPIRGRPLGWGDPFQQIESALGQQAKLADQQQDGDPGADTGTKRERQQRRQQRSTVMNMGGARRGQSQSLG